MAQTCLDKAARRGVRVAGRSQIVVTLRQQSGFFNQITIFFIQTAGWLITCVCGVINTEHTFIIAKTSIIISCVHKRNA